MTNADGILSGLAGQLISLWLSGEPYVPEELVLRFHTNSGGFSVSAETAGAGSLHSPLSFSGFIGTSGNGIRDASDG
jgi:hypothetical protein